MIHKLEIAAFNLQSALTAEAGGADRVELCDDIAVGGITPDHETIQQAKQKLKIALFIMVRPRGGNFVYSDSEFLAMKKDIEFCKEQKVDGIVFGILNPDNTIDKKRNKELVELAKPLSCSFHRAFDRAPEPVEALEQIIDCGFSRILTSGSLTNAVDGKNILAQLIKRSGARIIIMPGGSVRSENISGLKKTTNAIEFHSSAIVDKSNIANIDEVKLLKQRIA